MTPEAALINVEIVTYALAELGGADGAVHLERIAVKAHSLAPGSFRWDLDEYSAFVDKDKVRVSLFDAEKQKHGGLVEGTGVSKRGQSKRSDMWRLTSRGADWMMQNEPRVQALLGTSTPQFKKGKATALRRRVTSNPLYAGFAHSRNVEPNPYAFTDLLECSPDASAEVVQQRFDALRGQVRMLDDPELLAFVDACGQAHSDMLQELV